MAKLERLTKIASCVFYFARAGYYYSKWPIFISIFPLGGGIITTGIIQGALIALGSILIIVGVILWLRNRSWQYRSANPCLKIISDSVCYKELSVDSCESIREVEVCALSPINFFSNNFAWSGWGDASVEVIEGLEKAEILTPSDTTDNLCKVTFTHTLSKDECHKFKYKISLKNAVKPLRHFLGHSVAGPIQRLKLVATPLSSISFKQSTKELLPSRRSALALDRIKEPFHPEQVQILWDIPKPLPGCYYIISWNSSPSS